MITRTIKPERHMNLKVGLIAICAAFLHGTHETKRTGRWRGRKFLPDMTVSFPHKTLPGVDVIWLAASRRDTHK